MTMHAVVGLKINTDYQSSILFIVVILNWTK